MTPSTLVLSEVADPRPGLLAFVAALYVLLQEQENRQRRRTAKAQATYDRTLLAIVSVIAINAMAEVPPHDGAPINMDGHAYTGGPFSIKAVNAIMDGLEELGFVVRKKGFYDRTGQGSSFLTAFRHTWEFRDFALTFGLTPKTLISEPDQVIALNEGYPNTPMPDSVAESAAVIARYNARAREHVLSLPPHAWETLKRRAYRRNWRKKGHRALGYNSGKVYLRRVFTETYERGGRLYGGWWINLPGDIRRMLLIDGEPVAELDYGSLHPTMIAAEKRLNAQLDPYAVPGFPSRKAAKRMFNRVLNAKDPVKYDGRHDKQPYGSQVRFDEQRDHMLEHLEPISDKLQCDYGAKLQKKDGELALNVIGRCMDEGIPVYPVHDSFIVPKKDAGSLEIIMREEFCIMFKWDIAISHKD